jgi:peptidoglycan/LPS O-acetylase OafA/YrhL
MSFAVSAPLPLEAARSASPARPGRMLQLDGIRGLAVLSVLAWHWLPYPYLRYCPLGVIAVRVFFALSGFLITGILLRLRREHEKFGGSWWRPVKHFYVRRTLRIFPLYYAVLILLLIGGIPAVREHAPWYLLYASNFLGVRPGAPGGSTAHFWSLAVEEQFYIVWPWVILFTPRRAIPWVIGVMLAVSPLFRFTIYNVTQNYPATLLPVGCLDSLGMGALLGYAREEWRQREGSFERLAAWSGCLGAPILAAGIALYCAGHLDVGWIAVMDFGVALTAAWLIAGAARGFSGPVGWCLEFPPLIFIGTISYCVYVIHPFVHNLTPRALEWMSIDGLRARWMLAIDLGLTIAVASASWFFFESRLIRLGKTFAPDRVRDRGDER